MLSNMHGFPMVPLLKEIKGGPDSRFDNFRRINSIIRTPIAFVHDNYNVVAVYKDVDVSSVNRVSCMNSVSGATNVNNTKPYMLRLTLSNYEAWTPRTYCYSRVSSQADN